MLDRCNNSKSDAFSSYGGRGIKVCTRWQKSFEAFLEDVGNRPSPDHSLDRYPDNDGDYEPGNVRWATATEQNRNRRSSRFFTLNDERLTLTEWAARVGVSKQALRFRIKKWGLERALTLPRTERNVHV